MGEWRCPRNRDPFVPPHPHLAGVFQWRVEVATEYEPSATTGDTMRHEGQVWVQAASGPGPVTQRGGHVMGEAAAEIAAGETALGIELGSTSIKAVLIDRHGHVLATGGFDWENLFVERIWT